MFHMRRIPSLHLLALAAFLAGVSPSGAQTFLQDLDPGSVTEGAFADLFYYPEPRTQDQYAPAGENQQRQKSAQRRKNRSQR